MYKVSLNKKQFKFKFKQIWRTCSIFWYCIKIFYLFTCNFGSKYLNISFIHIMYMTYYRKILFIAINLLMFTCASKDTRNCHTITSIYTKTKEKADKSLFWRLQKYSDLFMTFKSFIVTINFSLRLNFYDRVH